MIYIFTALYCEAQVLMKRLHLKKVVENTYFQQFANESSRILLTITGVGEIAAASAVSSVCTRRPPECQDFLLNIGICAGTTRPDGIYLIHKLVEQASGKTFYPDILYRHEFQEAGIVTGSVPWEKNSEKSTIETFANESNMQLYDMEAAAVYQAGAYFFGPHQMIFLKVVSDTGETGKLSNEFVKQIMEKHDDKICALIQQLSQINNQVAPDMQQAEISRKQWFGQLCADLHCSKTMCDLLRQSIHYAALAGIDYQAIAQKMYQEHKLPSKSKREGKRRFEEFRQQLF